MVSFFVRSLSPLAFGVSALLAGLFTFSSQAEEVCVMDEYTEHVTCYYADQNYTVSSSQTSSLLWQVKNIASQTDRHLCSVEEKNTDDFFYSGRAVYTCGDFIKVDSPQGLPDAGARIYPRSGGSSFSCGGYLPQGALQDSRCSLVKNCAESGYTLCPGAEDIELCPAVYSPICAQPLMTPCPSGSICTQVMPSPRTYSNLCEVNKEGADFLHAGECGTTMVNPSIPNKCVQWYDGCNTCSVENGKISMCTERACLQNEEPYCMQYKDDTSFCTMEVNPVCGQPPMPICPAGMACAQVMPSPKTYTNMCQLNKAGAKYLYSGTCTGNTPPAGYEDDVITTGKTNPFGDTDIQTLEGKSAAFLYTNAVIGGFPDGDFKGQRYVNRAEASKFITRVLSHSVPNTSNSGFWDVKNGEWYVPYVAEASRIGIITGYSDGSFRPAETINTAELLTILARLDVNIPKNSESYRDVSSSDWFYQGALLAESYDLFPQREQYLFPESLVTRNELAVALYQLLHNQNDISLSNR